MFFRTSILEAFWEGLGRVWGGQNPWFSHFFLHFFDAKFGVQFGRAKNRKKRQQQKFSLIFQNSSLFFAVCAALGKRKKDRGKASWHESLAWSLGYAFQECFLKTVTYYLTRSDSLREAADVLRTYRRAAGRDEMRKWTQEGVSCRI